jgi:hypothetical protein
MSYCDHSEFQRYSDELQRAIKSTMEKFSESHSIDKYNHDAIVQMSVSFDDIVRELLMFGFDIWPEYSREDGELPTTLQFQRYLDRHFQIINHII